MVLEPSEQTKIMDVQAKQRNPAILGILDPLHRSLLKSNLQYEEANEKNSNQTQPVSEENDSDEYFTSVSTIASIDSVAAEYDAIENSKKFNANKNDSHIKGYQQFRQVHAEQQQKASKLIKNTAYDAFESGNRLTEQRRQSKQFDNSKQTSQQFEHLNVLDTENRCNTNNSSNGKQQRRLTNGTAWSKSHEQITQNTNRKHIRNSFENKAPLSSCCNNQRVNEDYYLNSRQRSLCKRFLTTTTTTTSATDYSDSSDINSETNLVIENMRNREYEMYRKISFNNGYFDATDSSSSGGYMHCRSHSNCVESASQQNRSRKCLCKNHDLPKKSTKFPTKRKCRSFPLTENQRNEVNNIENVITENQTQSKSTDARTVRNNDIKRTSETQTNTYQTNSRKITITIKTNTVPEHKNNNQQQQQQQQQQQCLTNGCDSSEESDTTVSDYATLCSESDPNDKQVANCDNRNDLDIASSNENESTSDEVDDDDDDNSFFSIKSDIECQSETSQYFNCASFTDVSVENNCSEPDDIENKLICEQNQKKVEQMQKKTVTHTQKTNKSAQNKKVIMKKSAPMICIEQELCENRIVTSKIEVDREKIKEFKRRHQKRSQPKIIIDNSFSEEIFNETFNRSAQICCDKDIIEDIVASLDATNCQEPNYQQSTKCHKNVQNIKQKFISDDFMFDKLQASPKYTGKSVSRLLAQQSITSVRRTLLQNVAYAITEKDKLNKLEKKKLHELAPIKPPRSFTASSSSSPLSKQSFESSATVPMSEMVGVPELDKRNIGRMGFMIPSTHCNNMNARYEEPVGEEDSVQFGWVRSMSNIDNNDPPASHFKTVDQYNSSSVQYYSIQNPSNVNTFSMQPFLNGNSPSAPSAHNMGFCIPKEEIDTVDSANRSNKDFERFSAILSENRQNNLSTPIKDVVHKDTLATDPTQLSHQIANLRTLPPQPQKQEQIGQPTEVMCKKCHCTVSKEKPQHALFSKTSKRIGRAALKRTKTLIGTSKNFLKKPTTNKDSPAKKEKKTPKENKPELKHAEREEVFLTPLKDGDNTVCNNRDMNSREDCSKRVNKSLNLTPKELNKNVIQLNPSPTRVAEISNIKLLRDVPKSPEAEKIDSEAYMTPDEAFDFDRVVNEPLDKSKTIKRSPSKMISKLAKSSKKLFHIKGRTDKDKHRSNNDDESTHYYKANDYDEVDNKVLLMGAMLSEMRKRIEDGHGGSTSNIDEEVCERPPSAKKCLFRDRTVSTSSGDILDQESLVEQIATIDLHDEPEPLYAEIEQVQQSKGQSTFYQSCITDESNEIQKVSEAVDLKEVYISDRADSQPSKYIMVNNNPKILYATVNRNSHQTRSLETIESRTEQSDDQTDGDANQSVRLTSSYESLDMSLINDFATAVQTELDECQFKMNEMFATATSCLEQTGADEVDAPKFDQKSNSGSESNATSDINSGCSSFYRRSKQIVQNRQRKTLSDFVDTLSFDTVGTGSYCESLSRGNDLNSEIKETITSLEYLSSEMDDSTDISHDMAKFQSSRMENHSTKESTKFMSFNQAGSDSSPSSSLYRTLSKNGSPSKFKKMSPTLKSLKTKFRNSFRMDSKKLGKHENSITDGIGSDETGDAKSCASASSGSSADIQRKKLFESICSRLEIMPNESLPSATEMKRLIARIRQQQEMRKSIQSALEVCRTNGEFHLSREQVEAEQLMLMSSLKECSALEKLIALWQSDCEPSNAIDDLGEGVLTIKYLEFELKVDSIFDTHFNYFYVCVCSYRDQVEFTESKERTDNRIVFNNLKIKFTNLTADFEIRVEIYTLRLRKNPPAEKSSEPILSHFDSSRFRLQGKTLLTSSNLSRKHVSSSYHSPRKLQRTPAGKYVYTSYGLISPTICLCGQVNTLCDSLKIGYQEQLFFADSKANGFLNIADAKQKWDRLWCRIDGFSMNFWNYPQDSNDTQSPILTLNLDQCNFRTKSLLVDREICPRPRTFKIDVVHPVDPEKLDRNRCIQSYFISAESQLDLELWLSEIQKIFEIIKSWNI